ncbi:type II CAAX endopeptidase family protein [Nonomuraea sp. NPDC000554]|uniref:CPBP family intramembrane glutamic endopeptidase n=1 Tax=Nonomuraea sp. NPDC000554 TaxID=3154259 RepID=UPI003319DB7A
MSNTTATDHGALQHGASPDASSSYVHGLRDRPQLWRTILAVLAGLGVLLTVLFVAAIPVGIAADRLLGVTPFDPEHPSFTIGFWIAGNLLLAALIPVSGMLQWAIYGERPRRLSSTEGGFRWRVLGRAAVFIVPMCVAHLVVLQFLMPVGAIELTMTTISLSVVALITVPLQSAGEEYLFRGLIFRAIGARFRRPAIAMIVAAAITALQFAAIHGSADGWTLAYYTLAGACFAVMVQATGGLEVAVLVHAVNNTLLLIPTILAGQLGALSVTTGPILLLPMLLMLLVTALVWKMAPRLTRNS